MLTPARDGYERRRCAPRPTKRRWVVASTILLAAWLGGLQPAHAAAPVSASQWSAAVCQSLSRWETQLNKGALTATRTRPTDPTAGKAAIKKYFAGALRATTKLARDVKVAGVPAVRNGASVAAALATSVKTLHDAFAKASGDAAALPTTDAAAFGAAARALSAALQAAGTDLSGTVDQIASQYAPALQKALVSNRTCRGLL